MLGTERSTSDYVFHYVYILESIKIGGWRYVGSTKDLKKRLEQHNRTENFSTKLYAPLRLIFYEAYVNKEDALRREKYLKTNKGSQVIRQMLKVYLGESRKIKSNI